MSKLILENKKFNDMSISFSETIIDSIVKDVWLNGTETAKSFGKSFKRWLRNKETKEYIVALGAKSERPFNGLSDLFRIETVKTKTGSKRDTYIHPSLVVPFARWISVDFSIWCDMEIKTIIKSSYEKQLEAIDSLSTVTHQQSWNFINKEENIKDGKDIIEVHKRITKTTNKKGLCSPKRLTEIIRAKGINISHPEVMDFLRENKIIESHTKTKTINTVLNEELASMTGDSVLIDEVKVTAMIVLNNSVKSLF